MNLMQVVSAELIKNKTVLLRLDIDVPLRRAQDHGRLEIMDDFRLKAGLPTLRLCLENAEQVIILGHLGRPNVEDPNFSVAPIYEWLKNHGFSEDLDSGKLKLLENLRFEKGEDESNFDYAKQLAEFGNFFVMEAFAAHHKAASTTVLPTILPHCAGLRFTEEVKRIKEVRENPKRPLIAIIGGVKIEDKLPAISALSKVADTVLVGGKLVEEAGERSLEPNVAIGELDSSGKDLSSKTLESWKPIIAHASMILWNGPLGKVEELDGMEGTKEVAQIIIASGAQSIVGGGDTIAALDKLALLKDFGFASTGGGAMLELLTKGTLPTIQALD